MPIDQIDHVARMLGISRADMEGRVKEALEHVADMESSTATSATKRTEQLEYAIGDFIPDGPERNAQLTGSAVIYAGLMISSAIREKK